jgi:hypothetical protein
MNETFFFIAGLSSLLKEFSQAIAQLIGDPRNLRFNVPIQEDVKV